MWEKLLENVQFILDQDRMTLIKMRNLVDIAVKVLQLLREEKEGASQVSFLHRDMMGEIVQIMIHQARIVNI